MRKPRIFATLDSYSTRRCLLPFFNDVFFYNTIQNLWLVFSEHVLVLWFENTLIIYSAEENSQAIEL